MPETLTARSINASPDTLTIEWSDGGVSEFASLWLRDNRRQDRDAHSGQRLIDVADVPARPYIEAAVPDAGTVRIAWQGEARTDAFDLQWLAQHAFERRAPLPERLIRLWPEGARLDARTDFAWLELESMRAQSALRLAWLTRLLQDGLAFVNQVPASEAAILETVPLIGRLLETNYGRTFDVRSVPQPENLAYSDRGLGLHTDNPYREPVPGFQALHALITSDEGGDSLFADGFAIGEHLRATEPEAFARLTGTLVPFRYSSADAELYAERPLIQLAANGRIAAVHYNSRSIAPLNLAPAEAESFYDAYRSLALLMRDARFQLRTRLTSGTLVVFDNQRTLHGRTAFSSARHPRHLRGCYLSRDSVYSEAGLLRRKLATA
jgi:alpha-ketoglutarate-dependent taurine dioxygenase